jgi:hypothetical protein
MMTTTRLREVDIMSAKNRQRRPVTQAPVPLPPWDKPARQQRLEAAAFAFLKRVLVDGDDEPRDCDPQLAVTMAGVVLGVLDAMHERNGMTAQQARAASKRMIADQARLTAAQVAMLSDEDTEGDE